MAPYSRYGSSADNFSFIENPLNFSQQEEAQEFIRTQEYWYNHEVVNNHLVKVPSLLARNKRIQSSLNAIQANREEKAFQFELKYTKRSTKSDDAEVYSLTARNVGWYSCNSCQDVKDDNVTYRTNNGEKQIFLKSGEIWKIGKHNLNGTKRYLPSSYEAINFDLRRVYKGNETQALIIEKSLIVMYYYHPENRTRSAGDDKKLLYRPAGNKRDK
jgi:hypothetical protein